MAEIMRQCSRVLAVVGQLVATGVPQHVRMHRNGNAAVSPVRASILRKPAGDIGADNQADSKSAGGVALRVRTQAREQLAGLTWPPLSMRVSERGWEGAASGVVALGPASCEWPVDEPHRQVAGCLHTHDPGLAGAAS